MSRIVFVFPKFKFKEFKVFHSTLQTWSNIHIQIQVGQSKEWIDKKCFPIFFAFKTHTERDDAVFWSENKMRHPYMRHISEKNPKGFGK